MGRWGGAFLADGRPVPVGVVHRAEAAVCLLATQPEDVDAGPDCLVGCVCPLYVFKEMAGCGDAVVRQTVAVVLDMWQKLAFTGVLVSSFVLLYQSAGFRKLVGSLVFYGRMSLTNYIGQSVIGALIYFPIGLSLAPYCGYTLSLLIGFLTFLLQVRFCKWWLSKHRQGPLERIWHKWTWLGRRG